MGSRWLTVVEDFLFTRQCAICDATLNEGERATGVTSGDDWRAECCPLCAALLDLPPRPGCRRCGADVGPHLETLKDCGFCRTENYHFVRTWRIGQYDGDLRRAVLKAKTESFGSLSRLLARFHWERNRHAILEETPHLIVPVPHLWWQAPWFSERPADVFAEELSARIGVPLDSAVIQKTRWIPRQTSMTPSGRRKNVVGAFRRDRRVDLSGATILLVDDVMTTGATANACARELKSLGAARVVVAVFARGLGRRGVARV